MTAFTVSHTFQAISVEYIWLEGSDKKTLKKFMKEKGYTVRAEVIAGGAANDYIFVKKGFNEDIELPDIHQHNADIPDLD